MKKLINDPGCGRHARRSQGIEAAHGDHVRVIHDPMVIVRADAPVQGKVGHHLRRRLRPRADARRVRRQGHARRRLSRRGLHVADARPDARGDQGRRRRRRRAAHRQELHRRRAQLRDGRRPGQGRGHRGRGGRDQRRRRRAGQPLHRRPPRRRHHRDRGEDLRRGRRGGQVARRGRRAVPQGQRPGPHAWAWRSRRASRRAPGSRASSSATTRWRSASASTASRAATARRSRPAEDIVERLATAIVEDLPVRVRRPACSRSSTAWAARR